MVGLKEKISPGLIFSASLAAISKTVTMAAKMVRSKVLYLAKDNFVHAPLKLV